MCIQYCLTHSLLLYTCICASASSCNQTNNNIIPQIIQIILFSDLEQPGAAVPDLEQPGAADRYLEQPGAAFPDLVDFFNNPEKNRPDRPNNVYDALKFVETGEGHLLYPQLVTVRDPRESQVVGEEGRKRGGLFMLPGHPNLSKLATQVTIQQSGDTHAQTAVSAFTRLWQKISTELYRE